MVNDPAGRPPRGIPVLLAGVVVVVLVAAVGLAARPTLRLPRHDGPDPHSGRDLALTAVAIVVGLVLIARAGRFAARYQRVAYRLVGAGLIIGPVIAVNPVRRLTSNQPHRPQLPIRTGQPSTHAAGNDAGGWHGLGDPIMLIVGPIALAGLALLGYVAFRTLRRPGRHLIAPGRGTPFAEAADVLGRAAVAIQLGPSARDRVIAAYEAMESALRGRGAVRAAQQAPLEWLAGLRDSHPHTVEPARELTDIFERARFSTAPISDEDAQRAGAALERLRGALTSSAGSPGGAGSAGRPAGGGST